MKQFNLLEWCAQYIRSRDAMERKLVKLEEKAGTVVATYKDRVVTFLPMPELHELKDSDGHVTIVCLQNQKNFNTLLADFPSFSKNTKLTIIFLNPALNEKWVLKPAIHASVADKATLKMGLQTMYQTVPPV